MDQPRYEELLENLNALDAEGAFSQKTIYLFGHCEATLTLADLLLDRGYPVAGILDNSIVKQGIQYRGIPVVFPKKLPVDHGDRSIVFIASRFYASMREQLRNLGFTGSIYRLIDYNSFTEYSLSPETIARKQERERRGEAILERLERSYPGAFRIFCPFPALGDVYLCMSYLPPFLRQRGWDQYVLCVSSPACGQVAALFGATAVEQLSQADLEAAIQAVVYTQDAHSFVAHQDRPYVVDLHSALYIKKIPLELIYRCGVFGLPPDTEPAIPQNWIDYPKLQEIQPGNAVILSPYAKSVPKLPDQLWRDLCDRYIKRGFQVFTNVTANEQPLPGTIPISPRLAEMKSVVERAGTFVGIRSGLCDVTQTANCRKIALYPDYFYSDTQWKAIEIYAIEGFENIAVTEDFKIETMELDQHSIVLSTLPKTWIFDLDGTLVIHNGYLTEDGDRLLPGAKEYLDRLPPEDKILILTSRTEEYRACTLDFLKQNAIRYDAILFNMPLGERIVVNDRKPSGLETAVAFNLDRNCFSLPGIQRSK